MANKPQAGKAPEAPAKAEPKVEAGKEKAKASVVRIMSTTGASTVAIGKNSYKFEDGIAEIAASDLPSVLGDSRYKVISEE